MPNTSQYSAVSGRTLDPNYAERTVAAGVAAEMFNKGRSKMQGQCVVAVYPSRTEAEQAFEAVIRSGVPKDRVKLSTSEPAQAGAESTQSTWDWLFGSDVPETDRQSYDTHLTQGGTALSVLVDAPSIAIIEQIEHVLDEYHPINVHAEGTGSTGSGMAASSEEKGEQVIPLPQEELKVGKRATERVRHIRTYVVEEPVEKQVNLRDERTVIEKRPATDAPPTGPTEREYEVREVHEEPVVQKELRGGEELVVRKEATERTERVADSVRKTKADVEPKKR